MELAETLPVKQRYKAREIVDDETLLAKLQSRSNVIGLALIVHCWGDDFCRHGPVLCFPQSADIYARHHDYWRATIGARRFDA